MKCTLGSIFRKSPFGILKKHLEAINNCLNELTNMFHALSEEKSDLLTQVVQRMSAYEQLADSLKSSLRRDQPPGIMMPIDRMDLLNLLTQQEVLVRPAMNIANLCTHRQMRVPKFMQTELHEVVNRSVQIVHRYGLIIEHLDELVEVGFQGREVNRVVDMIFDVVDERDRIKIQQSKLVHLLFQHETELGPVSVYLWHQILKWLGDIVDHTEEAGNLTLLLVAK